MCQCCITVSAVNKKKTLMTLTCFSRRTIHFTATAHTQTRHTHATKAKKKKQFVMDFFYLPHTRCRRWIKPCWGCKQSWLCLDGRACGLPSGVAPRTQRRKRRPTEWRSSVRGSASAGSLWLAHLAERTHKQHHNKQTLSLMLRRRAQIWVQGRWRLTLTSPRLQITVEL